MVEGSWGFMRVIETWDWDGSMVCRRDCFKKRKLTEYVMCPNVIARDLDKWG